MRNRRSKKDTLTPDQVKRLGSIGFSWDPFTDQWEEGFAALREFRNREGHCRVVRNKLNDEFGLSAWVAKQRQKKDMLTVDQIKRLDSIGFSWDPHSDQWEEAFAVLREFRNREGHCRVAAAQVIDGLKLGLWVSTQRTNKCQLMRERIERLDSLGFSWDPLNEQWESRYNALVNFKKHEGHCNVAQKYEIDGVKLGSWVSTQRRLKHTLSEDRIRRLNSLGFIWKV